MNKNLKQNVIIALEESKTLSLKTVKYRNLVRKSIEDVLMKFLQNIELSHIHTQLCYCLHELGSNAHRANLKRAFFQGSHLDINNPEEYEKGMALFKSETVQHMEKYQKIADEMGLYIKVDFHLDEEYLNVRIRNNVPVHSNELTKINKKIEAAAKYDNLMDAYATIEDSMEGAGLGIVTILQLLINSGCSPQCFSIYKDEEMNETVAFLNLKLENLQAPTDLEEL